jgi:hypothetical protein
MEYFSATFVKILYDEYKNKRIPPIGLYNIKTFAKDSKLYHKNIYGNQYNSMVFFQYHLCSFLRVIIHLF